MGPMPSSMRGKIRRETTLEGRPSYIPPRTFSVALLQTRDPRGTAQALAGLKQRLQSGLSATPPAGDSSTRLQVDLAAAINLEQVRDAVSQLPDGDPKTWALGVVESARHELDAASYKLAEVKAGFEYWFDHAMDRASGLYKRNTLKFLAVIALVLTLATGADSIRFVTRLYVDSTLRTQLAQQSGITDTVNQLEMISSLFGLRGSGPPPASTADAQRAATRAGRS
jgi:hypothetical protein